MSSRVNFTYANLKHAQGFRLLRIVPETRHSTKLRCVIEHFVLGDERCPEYTAISYCWGDPKNTESVIVNGDIASVTTNLAAALRQLQEDEQPDEQYLWADALCINQEDLREKTKQIELMPKIYTGARKVITWLSQEKRDVDHLSYLSTVLLKNPNRRRDQDAFVRAIAALSAKDYWSRIWIVQELSLAQEIEVACGSQRVSWSKFVQFACGHTWLPLSPGSTDVTPAIMSDNRIVELDAMRQDVQNKVPMPTIRALYRTRGCQSTIKADRIFALLGLTSDGMTKIGRLKYHDEHQLTMLNLTLAEFEEMGRLDLITFPDRRDTATYNIRTWAPNWINRALWRHLRVWQLSQVLQQSSAEFFRATPPNGLHKVDLKKCELKVHGYSLGEISASGDRTPLKYRSPSSLSAAVEAVIVEFPDAGGNKPFDWVVNLDNFLGKAHPKLANTDSMASSCTSLDDTGSASPNKTGVISIRALGSGIYRSCLEGLQNFLEPFNLRRRVSSNDWLVKQVGAGNEGDTQDDCAWISRDPAKFKANDERYANEIRALLYLASESASSSTSNKDSRSNSQNSMNAHENKQSRSGVRAPFHGGRNYFVSNPDTGQGPSADLALSDVRFAGTTKGLIGLARTSAKPGDAVYLIDGCSVPVVLRKRPNVAGVFEVVGEMLILGLMRGEFFAKKSKKGGHHANVPSMLSADFKPSDKETLVLI